MERCYGPIWAISGPETTLHPLFRSSAVLVTGGGGGGGGVGDSLSGAENDSSSGTCAKDSFLAP